MPTKSMAKNKKKNKINEKIKRRRLEIITTIKDINQEEEEYEEEEEEDVEEQVAVDQEVEEGGEFLEFDLKPTVSSKTHSIQPLGNLLFSSSSSTAGNIRDSGLGSLSVLCDELLLDGVLSLLSPHDLTALSCASKSLYLFSDHDPLWKSLLLSDPEFTSGGGDGKRFHFYGSWKSTLVQKISEKPYRPAEINIRNFYSDYLFQSWLCANLAFKPQWMETDNISRRKAANFTVSDFIRDFEEPNRPVLIEGCVNSWPAMRKWERSNLVKICGGSKFAVGPIKMTMEDYFLYAEKAKEERPLYLFDPKFADKVPELGSHYEVPEYFREDLFRVLGEEGRPDYRWIIIGPQGSGSSFHVDPNSTSAWNAIVKGSKKWVMFPPEVVPPGVHPSPDGAEVACPVSIMEWFMNFYGACKKMKKRPVECVCKTGEVVFVPNGWWHLVINLEDSIAITQNYVSQRNLLNVLDFLKKPNAQELVSGTKDRVNLYDKFRTAIEASFPGRIDELISKAEEKKAQEKKFSFWESVTDAHTGGFKFSF